MKNIHNMLYATMISLAAYGLYTHHYVGVGIAGIMVVMLHVAKERFTKLDHEKEKMDNIRRSMTFTSETMIEIYECESSAGLMYNPSRDMQVAG
jgi:hypothetical protein